MEPDLYLYLYAQIKASGDEEALKRFLALNADQVLKLVDEERAAEPPAATFRR